MTDGSRGYWCKKCRTMFFWSDDNSDGGLPAPDLCPKCTRLAVKDIPIPQAFLDAFKHHMEIEL